MRWVFGLALLVSSTAGAAPNLEWKWDSAQRYQLAGRFSLSQILQLYAEKNGEVGVVEAQVDLLTTCTPAPAGKKAWELKCELDEVVLRAKPGTESEAKLLPILEETDKLLTDAWVQIEFTKEGKFRSFDLENVPKGNTRTSYRWEVLRLMLQKTFSILEFPLPKGGDTTTPWLSDNLTANSLFSIQGSGGSVKVTNQASEDAGVVKVISQGEGHVSPVSDSNDQMWAFGFYSESKFDAAAGRLVDRTQRVDAALTATSGGGYPYMMVGRLIWRKPDERVALPVTGLLVE